MGWPCATLASERTAALRADGEPAASALNAGYHLAYLIGAALVVAAIVVAVAVLRSGAPLRPKELAEAEAEPTMAQPAYAEAG